MIIFRRGLLFVLLASMLGAIGYICFMRSSPANDAPISILVWFLSLFAVLVWCAVYLKTEPTLARIALAITTLMMFPMAVFAITQVLM